MAEEPALHLRERQHADDRRVALGEKVVRAVAEDRLEDLFPAGAVEERRLGAAFDERVPAREVARPRPAHAQVAGRGRLGELGGGELHGNHAGAPRRSSDRRGKFSPLLPEEGCLSDSEGGVVWVRRSTTPARLRAPPLLSRRGCFLNTASRPLLQEHAVDAVPAEVAQQPAQPVLGVVEVQVVAEARLHAGALHARLLGIELPRMEVEDRRLLRPPR